MRGEQALVIIPTYNEIENVEAIALAVREAAPSVHMLFVDDGSPDGTGELLDRLAVDADDLFVIHRSNKQGLGTAYVAGFRWGLERDYDLLCEMDADFSHDPNYLLGLFALVRDGADVAIGSRYIRGGGTVNWGFGRQFISRAGGLYARTILGVKLTDLTSGFVCYRREALMRLPLDGVQSNGYSFQIEMKYRAHLAGMNIREFPIVFEDRRVGQSKMSRAIVAEALLVVWKLRIGRGL